MTISHIRSLLFPLLAALLILAGCGDNPSSPTGSATFNLQWNRPESLGKSVSAVATDICSDYGLQTVTASFIDGNGTSKASGSFACSDHMGTVTGIPAASSYRVVIEGLLGGVGSTVAWRGEKTGVAIAADVNTAVNDVVMSFIGNVASVKLSTAGTVAAVSIKGVEVTVVLPTAVTVKADASGIPAAGVVVFSGVTPSGSSTAAKYTPAAGSTPGNVKISIANSTGFGVGDFVTITGDIASGVVPVPSQFILSGFSAFDGYGAAISGITATVGLVLK